MTRLSRILGEHQNKNKIKVVDEMFRIIKQDVYDPASGTFRTSRIPFSAFGNKWYFEFPAFDEIILYQETEDAIIEIASYHDGWDSLHCRIKFPEEYADMLFRVTEYLMEIV